MKGNHPDNKTTSNGPVLSFKLVAAFQNVDKLRAVAIFKFKTSQQDRCALHKIRLFKMPNCLIRETLMLYHRGWVCMPNSNGATIS